MQIKVVSLNVWQGGNLMPAIQAFLRKESADIVCLQEVYDGKDPNLDDKYRTVEVLRQTLGYEFDDFVAAYVDERSEGRIAQGNMILSRHPIIARTSHFLVPATQDTYVELPENFPVLPRVLQSVELAVGDLSMWVCNMHGVWDLDGDNYSKQRQGMRDTILQATANKAPLVLTGDSNAKASNRAMQELEPQLRSVFGTELQTTFNMRQKTNPGYAEAAVDLMFTSPDVCVTAKHCPDVNVSDHLPLVAVLELG